MDASSVGDVDRVGEFATGSTRHSIVSYRSIEPVAIFVDTLVVVVACAAWSVLSVGLEARAVLITLGVTPVACALFIPTAKLANLYHPSAFLAEKLRTYSVALLWFGTVALLAIGFSTAQPTPKFSGEAAAISAFVGLFGLLAHRACWRLLAHRANLDRGAPGRRAVLIHQNNSSPYTKAVPDLQRYGIRIEQRLNIGPLDDELLVRKRVELAVAIAQSSNADEVLIDVDARDWQQLKPHLACLRQLPLPVSLIAHDWLAEVVGQPTHKLGSSILVEIQPAPLKLLERVVKRAMDIAIAAAGIVVIFPFLALVAVMIKLDSSGPVLFRQTRIGFNGRAFKIYKLRTMVVLEDGPDIRQAVCDDDRVTPLGRWLRKTSIDELPQLFNVLKGDMSIVGPRPHAVSHDNEFGQLIADYASRRRMKPGITGWAQVSGYRGGTPKLEMMARRVQLDMLYIDNWSIWLDISIIARTVIAVARGQNAY
jgi:putative colanic acid biosynthesis UDP-glucose lipid carrier transferase